MHQYSVDVQRELPGDIAVEVGFVGSHTSDLTLGNPRTNINALNPSNLSQGAAALNAPVANPFLNSPYLVNFGGTLANKTLPAFRLQLPFPAYTTIYKLFGDSTVNGSPGSGDYANYKSMVIKASKRFSHGLVFLSTFTWSKNEDASAAGVGSSLNPAGTSNYPQNPYTYAGEYSYSQVDAPLRWATSISYELPFGKGKAFASNINKAADYIIGGWVINTVSVFQSGFPLEIVQQNGNSQYGYGAQRPTETGTSPVTSGSLEQRLYNYINPAAFTKTPAASFGNTPRTLGNLRGPNATHEEGAAIQSTTLRDGIYSKVSCTSGVVHSLWIPAHGPLLNRVRIKFWGPKSVAHPLHEALL